MRLSHYPGEMTVVRHVFIVQSAHAVLLFALGVCLWPRGSVTAEDSEDAL